MPTPPWLGITGHRLIPAELHPMLAARLDALFGGFARPGVLLSPLAEGADRLPAHRALAGGCAPQAVLPLPAAEYEAHFRAPVTPGVSAEASVAEFRALLAASKRVLGRMLAQVARRASENHLISDTYSTIDHL